MTLNLELYSTVNYLLKTAKIGKNKIENNKNLQIYSPCTFKNTKISISYICV